MMDALDPVQHHLRKAIEMNRQLHGSVQRKQEEISALKEMNAQLKELVQQAEIYAAVLDAFMLQPDDASDYVSLPNSDFAPDSHSSSTEPSEWYLGSDLQTSWLESLLNDTPPEQGEEFSHRILSEPTNTGVKRQLWPSNDESSSPAGCPVKKSRLDSELLDPSEHQSSECLTSETVRVFGAFRGFQLLKATSSETSELWKDGTCAFFKTSVREHSTVRTRVFPHGRTLTSYTLDGDCRFLWIPKQN